MSVRSRHYIKDPVIYFQAFNTSYVCLYILYVWCNAATYIRVDRFPWNSVWMYLIQMLLYFFVRINWSTYVSQWRLFISKWWLQDFTAFSCSCKYIGSTKLLTPKRINIVKFPNVSIPWHFVVSTTVDLEMGEQETVYGLHVPWHRPTRQVRGRQIPVPVVAVLDACFANL